MGSADAKFLLYLRLLYCLAIAGCVWLVASAIITSQTTGVVYASSVDTHASLVVSQDQHQAVFVGTGSARVRLRPGFYQLAVSDSGRQSSMSFRVYAKRKVSVHIGPPQSVRIPSVDGINFVNIDSLLDYGMPSSALDDIKLAFFHFDKNASHISVDSGTIQAAHHDPNNTSTLASISFRVRIDSKQYVATANYDLLAGNGQLLLYSLSGNVLFDSNNITVNQD